MKTSHRGAPLLPAAPLRDWIAQRRVTTTQLADAMGVHERRARALLYEQPNVSERTVERIGLALDSDPRLAAQLYPELDW